MRTDPRATRAILSCIDVGLKVWDPCCGDGALAKVLSEGKREVIATDLINYGFGKGGVNFFTVKHRLAPAIVMNPPFKLSKEFVQHALDLGCSPVVVFGRLAFLEGCDRKTWFEKTKLSDVYILSRRPRMWYGNEKAPFTGMIAFAWFVWKAGHQGPWRGHFLDIKEYGESW